MTVAVSQPETDQAAQDALNVQGRIRRRKEDELLLLALLMLDDVEAGAAEWQRLAPDPFKGLAQAQLASPKFPNIPEARATAKAPAFDPRTLEFVRVTGEVIPGEDVRLAALRAIAKAQAEFVRQTVSMEFGATELEDWFLDMIARVKRLHMALAIVGVGGKLQMPPAQLVRSVERIPTDLAEVETLADSLAYHLAKLYGFAVAIETAQHGADNAIAIERRILLYGESAYGGFEGARRVAAIVAGFTHEENILAHSEHCKAEDGDPTEDCPTQTDKGVVPIGGLVPIGQRICAMRCRCSYRFSRA